jgi:double jelly roll domain-containing protein
MTQIIDDRLDLDNTLQFNNSFKKEDYYKIPPVNGVENVNRPGNITFRCSNKEMYLALFDSLIRVKLTLKGIGDTMNLEHNAILRMFDSVKLMFGTSDIENLSSVSGEATTMVNFIVTSATFRETYGAISGWFPDDHKDANKDKNSGYNNRVQFYKDGATLMIPLKSIFGFTDYRKILHHIDNISLVLTRKSDATLSDEIFFGTAKVKTGTVDIEPVISFSEIEWWIPTYTLNLAAETMYEKRLNDKKTFDITYMKRHSSSVNFSASKYQWTITGILKQVRYVFLAFKSDANEILKNNALFTAKNIRSIQIRINGQLYPIQPMKLNTDQGDIAEPYLAYIEACNYFGNECQLKVHEFRDFFPIFCFNTSSQTELMQNGNEAVAIIEKTGNDNMEVFALCLEDAHVIYNISNGVVSDV